MEENRAHESLIGDAFDREYGLADLLPIDDISEIFAPLNHQFYIKIIKGNGLPYFALQKIDNEPVDQWIRTIVSQKASQIIPGGYWEDDKVLFPLEHEGEPIGYFSAASLDAEAVPISCFKALGNIYKAMLNRIIRLNCQLQMTSGLQSQVVEDSYARLQAKAEQLAQSEQKYRRLAESLEEEVRKKTETIQRALTTLAQQEKMASVGQLAAGVAHEINNPMGFIISNLGTLKDYGSDLQAFFETYTRLITAADRGVSEENRSRLASLFSQLDIDYILSDLASLIAESIGGAERIKKIVMDLKEFSEPGVRDAALVDVNELLQNVLRVCRTHFNEHISIKTDCNPLPAICCHPQQLNQVFVNILLNAVQAMEGKGRILIKTRTLEDHVKVSIEDTGCGIEKEDLAKIFDPFFTTKEVGKGTGLGLTFAYNVIRKHRGKISVESDVNQGSKFTLCLPYNSQ